MRVLNVEDSIRDSALIERELGKRFSTVELTRVDTPEEFAAALDQRPWDIIVADHKLPRFSSLAALKLLQASGHEIPLIVVSGTMGLEFAVEAMRAGARDYLVKNDLVRLHSVVEREVGDSAARRLLAARQMLAGDVLKILGAPGELDAQLRSVLDKICRHAGADAAGVRLRVKDDFPYVAQVGFGAEFLESERLLGIRDEAGGPVRLRGGSAELACLCGAVLRQRPQMKELLTSRGAFATGSVSRVLANAGHLPYLRGRCAQDGYQSLALLPLRSGQEMVGLLQLNARATDRFGPDLIQFLEEVTPSLALAVERRRAEEALRISEERYRVLVETSPNGVVLTALDGTIIKANRRLTGLLGVDEAEALEGCRLTGFVAEEDRSRAEAELASFVEQGNPLESLIRFRHGTAAFDGEVSWAVTSSDAAGDALVVVIRDVTERRKLQARLAQSDRMASVGMLAAGVAHEINNPLTYVLFNLESLGADLPAVEAAIPRVKEPLELVERARDALDGARRIREIVRDLKVFSQVGDERLAPISINKVVESVLNMAHNEVRARARLVTEFGRLPSVLANEGRLAQVFLNLIVNAAQAISEGDVAHNRIFVRTWAESGLVLAEVRDTGPGIPEELQSRIFEPFFTTKPAGIGSGLGLAISRGIIEEAGGQISVESRPGEGARFLVRLPAAAEDRSAAAPLRAEVRSTARSRRGRVLVVDDEAMIRTTLIRLLQAEHDVVAAESGSAAERALAADAGFDVILCDLIMPEVSGMDLHDRLVAVRPELAERMVFMTGGAFTQRASAFFGSVPNLRIEKPFDSANLKELVRVLVAARAPT